ncbi:uncharacterized protein [Triticum aestivum]|uniref:uncharacterized protein n=1 Tax=Triticum aestivum TaxID=4565 RepID=UPI001D00C2DD|nr:uncharacterized protein LOC123099317 [Triticum aestivum]
MGRRVAGGGPHRVLPYDLAVFLRPADSPPHPRAAVLHLGSNTSPHPTPRSAIRRCLAPPFADTGEGNSILETPAAMVPMKISGTSLATVTMPTQGTKRHPSTIVWFPITNVYSSNDMYEDYLHTYFQATQVSGSSYFWHHVNKNVHLPKNKIVCNIFGTSDGWLLYSSCACLRCSSVK